MEDIKILRDFRNDLLKRREMQFVLESEKNPGFAETRKIIVRKIKTDEENVAVKFVKNNFGTHEFVCEVFVYDSKKDLDGIEPKQKPKKAKGAA